MESGDRTDTYSEQEQLSYSSYEEAWVATQDLSFEELEAMTMEESMFSVDLTEATYRIPYDVIDEQNRFIGEVLSDFKPWQVFEDLFTTNERLVDMSELIRKDYWQGPEYVLSSRGTFMGDGMSFIHLTLLLSGITRSVFSGLKIKRPLGQSVGDDMLLLGTNVRHCLQFCWQAERLGCKFSKLNSISEDSATFCENYVARVSDLENYQDLDSFKESIFGDLLFLDIIKGSALSGQSKVCADGGDPFLGHATLLGKQVKWHPLTSVKTRSKVFLWARNFASAKKLSSSMASLPIVLGGLELAIGQTLLYSDVRFKEQMLPWYERILSLNERDFLEFYLLLRGIYVANPKGIPWANDVQVVREVTQTCTLHDEVDVMKMLPEWMHRKSMSVKLAYIEKEIRMVSFHHLVNELARQDSFLAQWNGVKAHTFMTLLSRDSNRRSNQVWGIIKRKLDPMEPNRFQSRNMKSLESLFQARTWGLYVSRDDPAIKAVFGGMPNLHYSV